MQHEEVARACEHLVDMDAVKRVLVHRHGGVTDEARPVHMSYDNGRPGEIILQRTISKPGRPDRITIGPTDNIQRITIEFLDGTSMTFPPAPDSE